MGKSKARLLMAFLTGAMLVFVIATIAALDELARLPFYYALPVAAVLVNSSAILLLFRSRRGASFFAPVQSKLAVAYRAVAGADAKCSFSRNRNARPVANQPAHNWRRQAPTPEQIEAALRKIHSVAWGFPVKTEVATLIKHEEKTDHAAQQ